MCLLGLDIGSSGCKATIIDADGNMMARAYREYPLATPRPGWQEIDPERVWRSVREVVSESLASHKGEAPRAVSVSSFGEAAVLVDKAGNVLHNAMMYIDCRGKEEAEFLENSLGYDRILGITGVSAHPMYTISKIIWLKKNRPDVYSRIWKILFFADFILFRLGADPHSDYSLAARSMAFDIRKKSWSDEILACAGVPADLFCEPVQAGSVVGRISPAAAEELGLPKGLLLVAGGHDQPCAALGCGIISGGPAVDGLGTTECITPAFKKPILSRAMSDGGFACVPHVIGDMYVTYAFTFTSGSIVKWYISNFGRACAAEAEKAGTGVYEYVMGKASEKPADIFVLPHFAGAATPYMDMDSKGAIVGLTIDTTEGEIIRAILEGVTFEMMVNLEALERAGIEISELRAVGGLSRYDAFLQLKADMMGRVVKTLRISEAGTLGVAILAGTAAGVFKDIGEAVSRLVKIRKEFHPDPGLHAVYREKFARYKKLYPAVKSIY